eukprot:CAMPEP_0184722884 /NCGR_PEP_ID=MMETSP0314-20130426/23587_1 /TAXON_ID=38298 /ORGANISM="Rhodella maculata, Strain CCMP 736" /LENGTH=49 /DNA_ID=CAMNT_0027187571 /DNA_START=223 /DNA_END=372 /DNA_ORIENTATION=+
MTASYFNPDTKSRSNALRPTSLFHISKAQLPVTKQAQGRAARHRLRERF